jgi:hypothetical protein
LPSLDIAFVDLLGGFQYKSSERSGSFSNMRVLLEQLESAFYTVVQLLSGEARPPPAEYSIVARI